MSDLTMPSSSSHPPIPPPPQPDLAAEPARPFTPSASGSDSESDDDDNLEPAFTLTVHHHNQAQLFPIYADDATLLDLSDLVEETLSIPAQNQKFHITPRVGLLRYPFADKHGQLHPLAMLRDKKIQLLGATTAEVEAIHRDTVEHWAAARRRRAAQAAARRVQATPRRETVKRTQDDARYTFHALRPLPGLPHPDKSRRFLEQLRDDAGIRAAMRKHRFSVGLLTEMDPASHTTHDSRTLGLNRNRGEVIELRLRTDAYDGYRDYKVIRKTLCHELTHNVWGEHDQNFWALCRQIEAEVARNDYRRGGHALGADEFYNPHDDGADADAHADAGGWLGGEYVLGGGGGGGSASTAPLPQDHLTRREILARAAEDRRRRDTEPGSPPPPGPSDDPAPMDE